MNLQFAPGQQLVMMKLTIINILGEPNVILDQKKGFDKTP